MMAPTHPTAQTAVYFASDFHFGIPDRAGSLVREQKFIRWLEQVSADALEIYLMGDLFDFWFEYHTVVPKGYVKLLGKIAEICGRGIRIHLFRGNHDLWAFRYLHEEVGVTLHRRPEIVDIMGSKFYLAHGDGLGPGDKGYKLLKAVFEFRVNQWLYRWIHPDLGTRLGSYFSRRSRLTKMLQGKKTGYQRHPIEQEPMVVMAKQLSASDPSIRYFVFGHVHHPAHIQLPSGAQCFVLGDWVQQFTYARFANGQMQLLSFENT